MAKELSIYIHYPFCKAKCPYCDFNSHVRDGVDHALFLRAYERELAHFAKQIGDAEIRTIFFGGGTPSLMPIELVEGILRHIAQLWRLDVDCEISLEANPTSFEAAKFQAFKQAGINRLSMGIQALNDDDLRFLGREHSAQEAMAAIEKASGIFDNFSFDLIYARPQQTMPDWEKELKKAIAFGTKHLSLYQLTIEKGTPFYAQFRRDEFSMPDDALAADFYAMTNQITADAGFEIYEISNYAKKGFACAHNMVYWQGGDYLGVGAGAHSRLYLPGKNNRCAMTMLHEPNAWLKKVEEKGCGLQRVDEIMPDELLEELLLTGLRMVDGVSNGLFRQHFNCDMKQIFDRTKLDKLVAQGLVYYDDNCIKIAPQSRILTNAVIAKVLEAVDVGNLSNHLGKNTESLG